MTDEPNDGECAAEISRLTENLNEAVAMLAKWCVAVADNEAGWDGWECGFVIGYQMHMCHKVHMLRG